MAQRIKWFIILLCVWLLVGCKELAIPSWTEITIPETTLQPTSTVTLTVEDKISSLSVTGQSAAVVWSTDEIGQHIGTFDIDLHSIKPSALLISPLKDYQQSSGDLVWSPTGAQLLYHRHNLYPWPTQTIYQNIDVFILNANDPGDAQILWEGRHSHCDWSPLGQYVFCNSYCGPSSGGGGDVVDILDANTRRRICDYGYVGCVGGASCTPLPLKNGEIWNLPAERAMEIPKPTLSDETQAVVTQLCQHSDTPLANVDASQACSSTPILSERFVALHLSKGLFVVNLESRQIWKVGADTKFRSWNWSADGRYLAWIEEDQIRVFDMTTHAETAYTVPSAKMLNVAWSPLQ